MINYEQSNALFGSRSTSGPSNVLVQRNANQIFTIDWSLLCDRKSNSGLASMANLNKPLYTIKISDSRALTGGAAIGDFTLFVVSEFWNICEIDPASRVISVRANN